MITEYKVSEKYDKYMLNILVKMDSTDAEISVVGIEIEDGQYDILADADKVVATFSLPKKTESPMVVKDAFAKWLEDGGVATLDAAIAGEPAPVVVVEEKPKPKAAAPKKAVAKKKPVAKKVEEELTADNDGIEKD